MVADGFKVTAEPVVDGTCQCSVKSPIVVICTDFQTQDNLVMLRDIQDQVRIFMYINFLSCHPDIMKYLPVLVFIYLFILLLFCK